MLQLPKSLFNRIYDTRKEHLFPGKTLSVPRSAMLLNDPVCHVKKTQERANANSDWLSETLFLCTIFHPSSMQIEQAKPIN